MEHNHVASLEAKHAGIESRITEEARRPRPDTTILARLKREKLKIKEAIVGI